MSMEAPGAISKLSLSLLVLALAAAPGALAGNGNTTIHVFAADGSEGMDVRAPLVPFNGELWGIAAEGGQYGHGTIFKITLDNNHTFSIVYSFSGGTDGGTPLWLTDGGDNNLYFLTAGAQLGPTTFSPGTFGSIAPTGLLSFKKYWATDGSEGSLGPVAYLAPDGAGNFLGTGWSAGPNGSGVVFGLTPSGTFNLIHAFGPDGDAGGTNPVNIVATGSYYAGASFGGGADNLGTVWKVSPDGSGFTVIQPWTPQQGGQAGGGITAPQIASTDAPIASWNTDKFLLWWLDHASGEVVSRPVVTPSEGSNVYAGLVSVNDGALYGAATVGPGGSPGTLFQFNPANGSYTNIFQFAADGSNGAQPYANPIQASDGFLYGATYGGGQGNGVIYLQLLGPLINTISPTSGDASGFGTTQINGLNFASNATVTVGGVSAPFVQYFDPTKIQIVLPPGSPGTLADVTVLNGDPIPGSLENGYLYDFLDVSGSDNFHDYVEKIFRHGITAGIGGGLYGRDNPVLRQQMAVFLEKAAHGSDYVPPTCSGVFADVPCPGAFTDWIEALAADGITGGCGGGNFCPGNPVTRQQMAVFLEKTKNGSSYTPPACTGIFQDVPCPSQFGAWIEELYNEGVTGGCQASPLLFCPTNPNTRGQMAVFLTREFGY